MNYDRMLGFQPETIRAVSTLMGFRPPVADHEDLAKEFVKEISAIKTPGKAFRKFDDFCVLFSRRIQQLTMSYDLMGPGALAEFEEVRSRYPAHDIERFNEMVRISAEALASGGGDFLGRVCGEMGALDHATGQFFTPFEVNELLNDLIAPDIASVVRKEGFFLGHEPTAGSGGMIVSLADHAENQGVNLDDVFIEAWELVPETFHMLVVQLSLRGVAAAVVCGNTLTGEKSEIIMTPRAMIFFDKHGFNRKGYHLSTRLLRRTDEC